MMVQLAMALLIRMDGDAVRTTVDEQNALLTSQQCVPYIVHGEIIAAIQMIIVSKIKGVSDFVMIHVCVDTTLYLLKFNLFNVKWLSKAHLSNAIFMHFSKFMPLVFTD